MVLRSGSKAKSSTEREETRTIAEGQQSSSGKGKDITRKDHQGEDIL